MRSPLASSQSSLRFPPSLNFALRGRNSYAAGLATSATWNSEFLRRKCEKSENAKGERQRSTTKTQRARRTQRTSEGQIWPIEQETSRPALPVPQLPYSSWPSCSLCLRGLPFSFRFRFDSRLRYFSRQD